jgi:hypothetical protein
LLLLVIYRAASFTNQVLIASLKHVLQCWHYSNHNSHWCILYLWCISQLSRQAASILFNDTNQLLLEFVIQSRQAVVCAIKVVRVMCHALDLGCGPVCPRSAAIKSPSASINVGGDGARRRAVSRGHFCSTL